MQSVLWVLFGVLLQMSAVLVAPPVQAAPQAGRIDSISPAEARPDDRVTINGIGFGGPNVQVAVGGVAAIVVTGNGNSATFVVPRGVPSGLTTVTAVNPGGNGGSIGFRVLLGFSVDAAASVSALIGPAGGVVRTRSSGQIYTLTLPPAALETETSISLTPVTSVANLPFSNGIPAAAQFGPGGLRLNRPATLTIVREQGTHPPGLLAFLVDDRGENLEVHAAGNDGTTLTLPIAHFTVGGAGAPTLQDLERQMLPLLNALPASLPGGQVATLVDILGAWLGQFGLGVCSQTTLCQRVFEIGVQSLEANRAQACVQMATFIQNGQPFLALQAAIPIVHIAVQLISVSLSADEAGVSGFDGSFDTTCVVELLHDVVDLAALQAGINPTTGLLMLFDDIANHAATLDDHALRQYADGALVGVIDATLIRAGQACLADPASGEFLIDVILNAFSGTYLDSLSPGLAQRVNDARAGCRVRIQPATPTVRFGRQLQFSAITVGLSPAGVTWSMLVPALGSSIDAQTGLFTAGQINGTVTVKATSLAGATLFNQTAVIVVPDVHISVTPATATVSVGRTVTFTAQVTGGTGLAIWTATGGSIPSDPRASATYTAPSTPGTYSVTATSVDDPTQAQTVPVVVTAGTLSGTITYYRDEVDRTVVIAGFSFGGSWRIGMTASVSGMATSDGSFTVLSASGSYEIRNVSDAMCYDSALPELIIEGTAYGFNRQGINLYTESGTVTRGTYNRSTNVLTLVVDGSGTDSMTNGDCTVSTYPVQRQDNALFDWPGLPARQNGRIVSIDFTNFQMHVGDNITTTDSVIGILR